MLSLSLKLSIFWSHVTVLTQRYFFFASFALLAIFSIFVRSFFLRFSCLLLLFDHVIRFTHSTIRCDIFSTRNNEINYTDDNIPRMYGYHRNNTVLPSHFFSLLFFAFLFCLLKASSFLPHPNDVKRFSVKPATAHSNKYQTASRKKIASFTTYSRRRMVSGCGSFVFIYFRHNIFFSFLSFLASLILLLTKQKKSWLSYGGCLEKKIT